MFCDVLVDAAVVNVKVFLLQMLIRCSCTYARAYVAVFTNEKGQYKHKPEAVNSFVREFENFVKKWFSARAPVVCVCRVRLSSVFIWLSLCLSLCHSENQTC